MVFAPETFPPWSAKYFRRSVTVQEVLGTESLRSTRNRVLEESHRCDFDTPHKCGQEGIAAEKIYKKITGTETEKVGLKQTASYTSHACETRQNCKFLACVTDQYARVVMCDRMRLLPQPRTQILYHENDLYDHRSDTFPPPPCAMFILKKKKSQVTGRPLLTCH